MKNIVDGSIMVSESFKVLFMDSSHHLRLKNRNDESLRLIGISREVGIAKKSLEKIPISRFNRFEMGEKFFTDN